MWLPREQKGELATVSECDFMKVDSNDKFASVETLEVFHYPECQTGHSADFRTNSEKNIR